MTKKAVQAAIDRMNAECSKWGAMARKKRKGSRDAARCIGWANGFFIAAAILRNAAGIKAK